MTTDLFYDWFADAFCKSVKQRPLLLIYDGHLTHISIKLIRKAQEEQVMILKLPPHVTDILQPLDVTCFGPLKREWGNIMERWTSAFGEKTKMNKPTFLNNLSDVWFKGLTKENVISGFRTTGIFPVDSKKYPTKRFDPQLFKKYQEWDDLGRPEKLEASKERTTSIQEATDIPTTSKSTSVATAPTPTIPDEQTNKPIKSSTPKQKQTSSMLPLASNQTPGKSPVGTNKCSCDVCVFIGPKPPPIEGKTWVISGWTLKNNEDPIPLTPNVLSDQSSFEAILMEKVKGNADQKPKKKEKKDRHEDHNYHDGRICKGTGEVRGRGK